jgi:hypothetical protein
MAQVLLDNGGENALEMEPGRLKVFYRPRS